ncbi:prepilin-type N-terminal cleavage/methylation domain-containing protein [Candidatus Saccharibacteria bacterium]|nr:prepilin-type N-terminal cleavage/methylation domain-containing protein [Candidatus Saccharibacteria bacterium]
MNKMNPNIRTKLHGFTIVELLIVIVVIAILAAISFVAYSGLQARARDSVRDSNVAQILNSAEMYAAEEGGFPSSSSYSCGLANSSLAIKYNLPQDLFHNPSAPDGFSDATNSCQTHAYMKVPGKKYSNWDEFYDAYNVAYDDYFQDHPIGDNWSDDQRNQWYAAFLVSYPEFACVDADDCSDADVGDEPSVVIKEEWRYEITTLVAASDSETCYANPATTGLSIRYWNESSSSWSTKTAGSGFKYVRMC